MGVHISEEDPWLSQKTTFDTETILSHVLESDVTFASKTIVPGTGRPGSTGKTTKLYKGVGLLRKGR